MFGLKGRTTCVEVVVANILDGLDRSEQGTREVENHMADSDLRIMKLKAN